MQDNYSVQCNECQTVESTTEFAAILTQSSNLAAIMFCSDIERLCCKLHSMSAFVVVADVHCINNPFECWDLCPIALMSLFRFYQFNSTTSSPHSPPHSMPLPPPDKRSHIVQSFIQSTNWQHWWRLRSSVFRWKNLVEEKNRCRRIVEEIRSSTVGGRWPLCFRRSTKS